MTDGPCFAYDTRTSNYFFKYQNKTERTILLVCDLFVILYYILKRALSNVVLYLDYRSLKVYELINFWTNISNASGTQ